MDMRVWMLYSQEAETSSYPFLPVQETSPRIPFLEHSIRVPSLIWKVKITFPLPIKGVQEVS
jgi:hypothetical protein